MTGSSSLNLISDAAFNVHRKTSHKAEEVENCTLADLCVESLREVAIALQKEHELPYSPLLDIHTVLRKDTLSVDDHSAHAKGRFLDFLEKNSIPTKEVSATFRSLLYELQKRSNCESAFSASEDLKSKKGFSRDEFSKLLDQMKKASETDRWVTISHQLTADGLDLVSLRAWQRAWATYRVERLDYSNEILQKTAQTVGEAVDQCLGQNIPMRPLTDFIQEALLRSTARLSVMNLPVENNKVIAIILTALDEIEQSPSTGAQS
jgi:hypothetical protein